MNEKRFELDGTGIFDNKTNRFFYKTFDNEEVVDLLNELSEENEQLKSYIDSMFLGNTHICKELDIEDAMFYCEKEEKHIYPNCLYHKCFDEENLVEVKEEIRKC